MRRRNNSFEYKVKEWEQFQPYKKGSKNYSERMPWFKCYGGELLDDDQYLSLEPEVRDTLTLSWMMASQAGGKLVSVEAFAKRVYRAQDTEKISKHFELLLNKQYIERIEEQTTIKERLDDSFELETTQNIEEEVFKAKIDGVDRVIRKSDVQGPIKIRQLFKTIENPVAKEEVFAWAQSIGATSMQSIREV